MSSVESQHDFHHDEDNDDGGDSFQDSATKPLGKIERLPFRRRLDLLQFALSPDLGGPGPLRRPDPSRGLDLGAVLFLPPSLLGFHALTSVLALVRPPEDVPSPPDSRRGPSPILELGKAPFGHLLLAGVLDTHPSRPTPLRLDLVYRAAYLVHRVCLNLRAEDLVSAVGPYAGRFPHCFPGMPLNLVCHAPLRQARAQGGCP